MKLKTRILLFVFMLGMILFILGIGNTLLLFKGKTVDLTDPVSSFSEKALCQGKIDFVIGPFATLEETRKRYGVTTSKTETDFFIVSNMEEGSAFVVFSTANTAMRQKLTDASKKWQNYLEKGDFDAEVPNISIEFAGKLAKQYSDDDFDEYYSDVKGYLGLSASDCAKMRIMDGKLSSAYPITTAVGGIIGLGAAAIFIAGFVKERKQQKADELW